MYEGEVSEGGGGEKGQKVGEQVEKCARDRGVGGEGESQGI